MPKIRQALFKCALDIYRDSNSWAESYINVKKYLSCFSVLDGDQIEGVLDAFRGNGQNCGAWNAGSELEKLFSKWTNKNWQYWNGELSIAEES